MDTIWDKIVLLFLMVTLVVVVPICVLGIIVQVFFGIINRYHKTKCRFVMRYNMKKGKAALANSELDNAFNYIKIAVSNAEGSETHLSKLISIFDIIYLTKQIKIDFRPFFSTLSRRRTQATLKDIADALPLPSVVPSNSQIKTSWWFTETLEKRISKEDIFKLTGEHKKLTEAIMRITDILYNLSIVGTEELHSLYNNVGYSEDGRHLHYKNVEFEKGTFREFIRRIVQTSIDNDHFVPSIHKEHDQFDYKKLDIVANSWFTRHGYRIEDDGTDYTQYIRITKCDVRFKHSSINDDFIYTWGFWQDKRLVYGTDTSK